MRTFTQSINLRDLPSYSGQDREECNRAGRHQCPLLHGQRLECTSHGQSQ